MSQFTSPKVPNGHTDHPWLPGFGPNSTIGPRPSTPCTCFTPTWRLGFEAGLSSLLLREVKKIATTFFWFLVVIAGAWAYATVALHRGEHLNSAFSLITALCSYAIGYRFYSKWIAARVLMLNDRRATPCEVHDDGKDFVKTNKWIVFGHHFAAIAGPGPLVGPVLAAQFGYLPGTLWILIGVTLGGAVQDFVVLF